jgi:hypothetical protein
VAITNLLRAHHLGVLTPPTSLPLQYCLTVLFAPSARTSEILVAMLLTPLLY